MCLKSLVFIKNFIKINLGLNMQGIFFLYSHNYVILEFYKDKIIQKNSFFVRCKRTYVLNNSLFISCRNSSSEISFILSLFNIYRKPWTNIQTRGTGQ